MMDILSRFIPNRARWLFCCAVIFIGLFFQVSLFAKAKSVAITPPVKKYVVIKPTDSEINHIIEKFTPTEEVVIQPLDLVIPNISKPLPTPSIAVTPNPVVITHNIATLNTVVVSKSYDISSLAKTRSLNQDIQVDGYYQTSVKGKDFNPKDANNPLYNTIQNDDVYNDTRFKGVTLGAPRIETEYKFNIEGKLSKDLSVYWNIEQQPDFPGKYDVRVKNDKTELSFGDINADFRNGEFIQVNKGLNGVKLTSYDQGWQGIIAAGKERSEPKKDEAYGNGGRNFKLSNKSILEGTVRVYVDNVAKAEGKDYTVNYYNGEINFIDPVLASQLIRVIYEYTNPIEDFIPIPNRKNFLGAQYTWSQAQKATQTKLVTASITERLIITGNIFETDGSVQLQLANNPVILASEVVLRNQRYLKRDKMYFLRPLSGKIIFPKNVLNIGDQLEISYDYYITKQASENIQATGIRGPYFLGHSNIIKDSLACTINQADQKIEGRDFTLDAKEGKLYFNSEISFADIQVAYNYLESKEVTLNQQDTPLSVGITYLDESVNQQLDALVTAIYNETPVINSNVLSVTNVPINPSASIVLDVDGSQIATENFTIDYYKGLITLPYSVTGKSVKISYSYNKNYQSDVVFYGKDGWDNRWYNSNSEFNLANIPVQYKGVYQVSLWGGAYTTEHYLTEGRDFAIDYQDNGSKIAIRFLKKIDHQGDGLGSDLLDYPDSRTRIHVKYYYNPEISPNGGNIMQKMLGTTFHYRIDPNWTVDTELSLVKHNFSKPRDSGTKTMQGNGQDNATYVIQKNMVENSESVYINNILLTKDTNYWINYEQGQLKFINYTPSATDNIKVVYQYYVSGETEAANTEKNAMAYKLRSDYQWGDVAFYGEFKNVDKDFLPISDIVETNGTMAFGGGANWLISRHENMLVDYHRRYIYVTKNDAGKDSNLVKDDFITQINLLLFDYFDTRQNLTLTSEVQDRVDLTTTADVHPIDRLKFTYSPDVIFGPDYAMTTLSGKISQETNDYIDKGNLDDRLIRSVGFKSALIAPQSDYYKKLTANPYSYYTVDATKQTNYSLLEQNVNYGLTSEYIPINILTSQYSFDQKNIRRTGKNTDGSAINLEESVRNLNTRINLTPYDWLDTGYDYAHTEAESPLVLQKGKIEDNTTYAIKQFLPYNSVQGIGLLDFLGLPVKGSRFSSKWNSNTSSDNNDRYKFNRNYEYYEYRSFQPIPWFTFNRLSYEKSGSDSSSTVENSSTSANYATTTYNKKEGELNIKPDLMLLNFFAYNIKLSDKKEARYNLDIARASTDNIQNRSLPEFSRQQKLAFDPGSIGLGIPGVWVLNFGRFSAAVSEDLIDNTDITIKLASSNISPSTNIQNILDNKNTHAYLYETAYSPFNIADLTGKYRDSWEYYNRNVNADIVGSLYKINKDYTVTGAYSPWNFITFHAEADRNYVWQWNSGLININRDDLKNQFSDKLDIIETNAKGDITFTPWTFISFKLGLEARDILQSATSANIFSSDQINQDIKIAGIILRPILDMTLSTDYLSKQTYKNASYQGTSFGLVNNFSYKPKIIQGFTMDITAKAEYNRGRDLNYLDMNASLQGSNRTLSWEVVDRNDLQVFLNVGIDIDVPITAIRYIEKFIISCSGRAKYIKDYANAERSYNLSGFICSGKLLF